MIKNFILIIFLLSISCIHAESYFQPHVGLNRIKVDSEQGQSINYDLGLSTGLVAGYAFKSNISCEAEFCFNNNNFINLSYNGLLLKGEGALQSYSTYFNFLYYFPRMYDWARIYMGAGVGYEWVVEKISLYPYHTEEGTYIFPACSSRKRSLCSQGKIGIELGWTESIKYSLEYNFHLTPLSYSSNSLLYKVKFIL